MGFSSLIDLRTLSGYNNSFFREACAIGLGMGGNGCIPYFPPLLGRRQKHPQPTAERHHLNVKLSLVRPSVMAINSTICGLPVDACDCFLRLAS